jgi:hypothetical protein
VCKINTLKKFRFFNDELIRLLEKHQLKPAQLAKRAGLASSVIYDLKSTTQRRSLGDELFIKILRKGFRYSEKETKEIFTKAVLKKYFSK